MLAFNGFLLNFFGTKRTFLHVFSFALANAINLTGGFSAGPGASWTLV